MAGPGRRHLPRAWQGRSWPQRLAESPPLPAGAPAEPGEALCRSSERCAGLALPRCAGRRCGESESHGSSPHCWPPAAWHQGQASRKPAGPGAAARAQAPPRSLPGCKEHPQPPAGRAQTRSPLRHAQLHRPRPQLEEALPQPPPPSLQQLAHGAIQGPLLQSETEPSQAASPPREPAKA